nr:fimbrial protein [Shewanella algae]
MTHSAWAGCTRKYNGITIVPPANIVVQRDTPIGTELGRQPFYTLQYYSCTGDGTVHNSAVGFKPVGSYTNIPGVTGYVFDTNIPGIGFVIGSTNCNKGGAFYTRLQKWDQYTCGTDGYIQSPTETLGVIFYKTGKTSTSGTTSKREAARIISLFNGAWEGSQEIPVYVGSTNVQVLSCQVDASAVNVPMGSISKKEFSGVGSTSAEQLFTISLRCDAGTKVNLTLDAIKDASGRAGVIALSDVANKATGVGVELRYNNSPVTFGQMLPVATVASSGDYLIPLQARYYQTAPTVTPGVANAVATFTMTYQ